LFGTNTKLKKVFIIFGNLNKITYIEVMNELSLIIPTYRNPEYLDLCLKSAIQNQVFKNEILVVVDGFYEESESVLEKYKQFSYVHIVDLEENQGMQHALNVGAFNASNSLLLIINDDNVLCEDWDTRLLDYRNPIVSSNNKSTTVVTINQIEPKGPSIFGFHIKDFGTSANEFKYEEFLKYERELAKPNITTPDGGIFPFLIRKKDYMRVGGFDTLYPSPFICDWDFFLKLQLSDSDLVRTHSLSFYHFGSTATKKGKESLMFTQSEIAARETFKYKWGMEPRLYKNNLHGPKGHTVKGIKY